MICTAVLMLPYIRETEKFCSDHSKFLVQGAMWELQTAMVLYGGGPPEANLLQNLGASSMYTFSIFPTLKSTTYYMLPYINYEYSSKMMIRYAV
jgi:hypothetical protein